VVDTQRVVDTLFDTLLERARHVLVGLRETPDDSSAVRTWAIENGLGCEQFIHRAIQMRSWWTSHPRAAEHMRRYWHNGFASYHAESDAEKAHRASLLSNDLILPQYGESLAAWLRRARQIHAELSIHWRHLPRRMPRRPHEIERHVRWFVDIQVLGIRPTDLAKRESVDRAAVERATNEIAECLHITRRRYAKGRPRRKSARN
jgi:hypothetical protein